MKQLIALMAAAGLTLAACNKEEPPKPAPANSSPSSSAPAPSDPPPANPDPAAAPAGDQQPANAAPAEEEASKPSVDVANDPRRATAQGTLEMFVDTMREADYETSLELLDPASDGYAEIQDAFNAMLAAKDKFDGTTSLADLYKTYFARPWHNATLEKIGEQEGHVQYLIKFQKAEPVSVDIRNGTGQWLIIAPGSIFVLEQMEEAPAAVPTAPPAPPPAPAGGGN